MEGFDKHVCGCHGIGLRHVPMDDQPDAPAFRRVDDNSLAGKSGMEEVRIESAHGQVDEQNVGLDRLHINVDARRPAIGTQEEARSRGPAEADPPSTVKPPARPQQ